ncbi:PREDICTED: lysM and putative peptidoglycan-binding domain-containing protein 2 [Poecilia mexicana]|uniref:LysM and putative peptidoglycan-binding domain-containing protein 2 n=3 Tax=Poecilia TaxID=8080 RepID=A0A087YIP8_POEFO|nr:PREDICTED: lysM and putative peptidoglycan-binding domain-containing protein 2 [Poecilia formosa]XP_014845738.1 PREDICTED: lysM and putative peptidoglycan-binding domain-containing protein 2 [Poecilia mexicana]
MAEFSPVLPMRDGGGGRLAQPIFPRSRSGSESESELSQSLARTKIRSYGSTASVTASLGEKYIEHRVTDSDTLQGIALKYGVTMEQIKRANKLFSNDCIFLRNSLNIPVVSEKRSIFNGLSLESPDGDGETANQDAHVPHVMTQDIEGPSPSSSPPPENSSTPQPQPQPQPEELSAKDFLHRLDLQIKQSKQAAQRLKEEEVRSNEEDDTTPKTSYHEL